MSNPKLTVNCSLQVLWQKYIKLSHNLKFVIQIYVQLLFTSNIIQIFIDKLEV